MSTHIQRPQAPPTQPFSSGPRPAVPANINVAHPQPSITPNNTTDANKPKYLAPRTEFLLDWTIKVLGVAAAILFGIWAPISYKATADGNAENNASQDSLMSSLSALSVQATNAADLQSSAASGISELRELMSGLATLSAWEFCDSRASSIRACDELSASVTIDAIINSLVGTTTTDGGGTTASTQGTASASAEPPETGAPGSSAGRRGAKIGLAATLGIVFGVLAFVGLIVGLIVSRRKFRSSREWR